MAHTIQGRHKLLARVRRIQGQVEGIARALESENECTDLLQLVASTRGALNGLMAELIEGHLLGHVLDPRRKPSNDQRRAASALLQVVKTYFR